MTTTSRWMKIEYAATAARAFARQLCRLGSRGALMTFGNTFQVEVPFTENLDLLDRALATLPARLVADIRRRGIGEGPLHYDSLASAESEFARFGDHERPFVLVDLTDGNDNRSKLFGPALIGQHMARRFSCVPGNHAFLIGVGRDDQLDRQALATIGNEGGFPAVLLDSFGELQECFARIAHKVIATVRKETIQGPGFVINRTTPALHVISQPIDFAFLIDRSGSMAERA